MILQNDFKRQWVVVEKEVREAVSRVGASGWYILGEEVKRFEEAIAKASGVAHAVGVANGMDALEIALRCLQLGPDDKVLTTPLTAFATTLAIMRAGAVPVFVDVDENGAVDLQQCRAALERDRSIRFFVPVHLYGEPIPLAELKLLKGEFELAVVEDCAQAIGATEYGQRVGSVGQVAATSFYPTKNLGALGDGGALFTDDDCIAARARAMRNYGQSSLYVHDEIGLNSRLDELHAAVLNDAFLPRLAEWTQRRRATAKTYSEGIRNQAIRTPRPRDPEGAVWHLYPVFVDSGRDELKEHLRASGIACGIHYPSVIPDQEALRKYGNYEVFTEPVRARALAASELSLPIHPFLTDEEVAAVIDACNRWRS